MGLVDRCGCTSEKEGAVGSLWMLLSVFVLPPISTGRCVIRLGVAIALALTAVVCLGAVAKVRPETGAEPAVAKTAEELAEELSEEEARKYFGRPYAEVPPEKLSASWYEQASLKDFPREDLDDPALFSEPRISLCGV